MREPVLPPGVPQPLDQELLAWAAGFFDGEGTTIARSDAQRPDYSRLQMSVPQSGRDGIPSALLKFQRAMLGTGRIYRQPDPQMHTWNLTGQCVELALALIWPWLGDVKRAQASTALETVRRQYVAGTYARRAARYRPTLIAHVMPLRMTNEMLLSRAWAAGFMDAEGYFGTPGTIERLDGTRGLRLRASATQHGQPTVAPEVLLRLQRVLRVGSIERHGLPDDFKWATTGAVNVRRVLELLRPWLGEVKTAQAEAAIAIHEASRVRGDAERCIRGHVYDSVYIGPDGIMRKKCGACRRIRDRAKRAGLGGVPRTVASLPEDPTRVYHAHEYGTVN